ncbi:hypothetical protein [Streptomyces sp. NPDC001530]|uniref:hypothetical protein n=1 Tax=Streptomyces sp. NPDC001530 TaxID=3364582 RepID=UPI0036C46AFC
MQRHREQRQNGGARPRRREGAHPSGGPYEPVQRGADQQGGASLAPADSTVREPAPAFSGDRSLLAASRADGSVRVWETASPRLPGATLPAGDGPVLAVGFTQGGRELHVATAHMPFRSPELAPDRAAAEVCARAGGGESGRVAQISARCALQAYVLSAYGRDVRWCLDLDFESAPSDELPSFTENIWG